MTTRITANKCNKTNKYTHSTRWHCTGFVCLSSIQSPVSTSTLSLPINYGLLSSLFASYLKSAFVCCGNIACRQNIPLFTSPVGCWICICNQFRTHPHPLSALFLARASFLTLSFVSLANARKIQSNCEQSEHFIESITCKLHIFHLWFAHDPHRKKNQPSHFFSLAYTSISIIIWSIVLWLCKHVYVYRGSYISHSKPLVTHLLIFIEFIDMLWSLSAFYMLFFRQTHTHTHWHSLFLSFHVFIMWMICEEIASVFLRFYCKYFEMTCLEKRWAEHLSTESLKGFCTTRYHEKMKKCEHSPDFFAQRPHFNGECGEFRP